MVNWKKIVRSSSTEILVKFSEEEFNRCEVLGWFNPDSVFPHARYGSMLVLIKLDGRYCCFRTSSSFCKSRKFPRLDG
mgnify:CR=1 FL=1